MSDDGLHRSSASGWRLAAGALTGVVATFAVYTVDYIYTVTGYCVSCRPGQTAQTVFALLAGSGLLGLVLLGFMPDSFADPVVLVYSAVPFLALVIVGAALAEARRARAR